MAPFLRSGSPGAVEAAALQIPAGPSHVVRELAGYEVVHVFIY